MRGIDATPRKALAKRLSCVVVGGALVLTVLLGVGGSQGAPAGVISVGPHGSIQAAIDSAPPGATIQISAGTFPEQLTIDQPLKLVGAGVGRTFIAPPGALLPDALGNQFLVEIGGGAQVTLTRVTILLPTVCDLAVSGGFADSGGIGVGGGANLTLTNSQLISPNSVAPSCPGLSGTFPPASPAGIAVGLDDPIASAPPTALQGFATIEGSSFSYAQNFSTDIRVGGTQFGAPGSYALILGNRIATPPSAFQFATVLVAGFSTATISGNIVTGPVYYGVFDYAALADVFGNAISGYECVHLTSIALPPCGSDPINDFQSAGVLLISPIPGTVVAGNLISGCDVGVYDDASTEAVQVTENLILDSADAGVFLQDGVETFSHNIIVGAPYAALAGGFVTDTTLTMHDNLLVGISVAPAQTGTFTPSLTATVLFD